MSHTISIQESPRRLEWTGGNLDYQNCVSVAKPSQIQLVNNPVVHGALAANPATSINALVAQLRHQKKVTASQHVMYRAKDCVMAELHDGEPLKIRLLPSLLAEFQRLNAGVLTEVQCDERGRFRRAVLLHSHSWLPPSDYLPSHASLLGDS
ncbi:hypothetical protein Plhal703r1_c45g0146551 [Plasmopara halstedii]